MVWALVCYVFWGAAAGYSGAYGGAVGFLSATAYALRASMSRKETAHDWLKAQYAGERFKFFVTVVLMVGIAKLYPGLHWLVFLLGFMATMLVYFLALLWDR